MNRYDVDDRRRKEVLHYNNDNDNRHHNNKNDDGYRHHNYKNNDGYNNRYEYDKQYHNNYNNHRQSGGRYHPSSNFKNNNDQSRNHLTIDQSAIGKQRYDNHLAHRDNYSSYHDGNRSSSSYYDYTPSYSSVVDPENDDQNDNLNHFAGTTGDVIDDRYEIRGVLGKGTFGLVFKCHDKKHDDFVAIKVVRAIKRYVKSARIEAKILDYIFDKQKELNVNLCVKMYSHFKLYDHYCLVFQSLGLSLYDLVKMNNYEGLPISCVQGVAKQLMEGLQFLKEVSLIHTDLKLENILFVHNSLITIDVHRNGRNIRLSVPQKIRIKLIDFGGATYENEARASRIINTRQYRGPEVILELGWSYPSDIWSAGCIIAEIYSGDLLFKTHDELEHLVLMVRIIGKDIPSIMIEKSPFRDEYFHKHSNELKFDALSYKSKCKAFNVVKLEKLFTLTDGDFATGIYEFLSHCLDINPYQRCTPSDALMNYRFLK